tara:strand:- start:838 stop:1017 length:180 start_codon:yes stop_codon:yes gene_type:complete
MSDASDILRKTREELVKCRNLVLQLQEDCRTLTARRRESENEKLELKETIRDLTNDNDE